MIILEDFCRNIDVPETRNTVMFHDLGCCCCYGNIDVPQTRNMVNRR
jgi:hypothetical protein